MTKAAHRPQPAGDYEVGYRKPPVHTRFRKGQSGNPRGRPRDGGIERTRRIVLEEAYRKVTVREGDKVVEMPAIRAVMRSHLRDALKGQWPQPAGRPRLGPGARESDQGREERHRGE